MKNHAVDRHGGRSNTVPQGVQNGVLTKCTGMITKSCIGVSTGVVKLMKSHLKTSYWMNSLVKELL